MTYSNSFSEILSEPLTSLSLSLPFALLLDPVAGLAVPFVPPFAPSLVPSSLALNALNHSKSASSMSYARPPQPSELSSTLSENLTYCTGCCHVEVLLLPGP